MIVKPILFSNDVPRIELPHRFYRKEHSVRRKSSFGRPQSSFSMLQNLRFDNDMTNVLLRENYTSNSDIYKSVISLTIYEI